MNYNTVKNLKLQTLATLVIILSLLFLFDHHIYGQHLTFEEKVISLQDAGDKHAIQVLCEPGVDHVREAFDEYMDDHYDVKMNTGNLFGKHKIIKGEGIHLDPISPKEMNLYARIIENGDLSELSVYGSFGPDVPITRESYPAEYNN